MKLHISRIIVREERKAEVVSVSSNEYEEISSVGIVFVRNNHETVQAERPEFEAGVLILVMSVLFLTLLGMEKQRQGILILCIG